MMMKRRTFLRLSTAATTASMFAEPGFARGPIARSGEPRFRLSLAAYSLRHYFPYMKGKARTPADDGPPMDMFRFIDYCGEHGCEGAELTSYFFPPEVDEAYLLRVKQHAYLQGVAINGTAIGNNFSMGAGPELEQQIADACAWIDKAVVLGAPHIRFFAGTAQHFARAEENLDHAVAALQTCADYAATRGIFLGVENHGKITPELLLTIMRKVKSPWVGINLDTGNFASDDPYADLERCLPYAVNVQVKMSMRGLDGVPYPADFDRIADILRKSRYQGYVVLEYEAEDPYGNIPKTLERLRSALQS